MTDVFCVTHLSKQRSGNVAYRNIRLKMKNYERLEEYKLALINEKKDSHITLDDAVESLLDRYHKRGEK